MPSDTMLRVMAHGSLNRSMQQVDPLYVVMRYASHYSFEIEPARQMAATRQPTIVEGEAHDWFDEELSPVAKWEHAAQIILRDKDAFFDDCFGLTSEENLRADTTSEQKWLLAAYWALRHVGTLRPRAKLSKLLSVWLGDKSDPQDRTPDLALHAHCLVHTPDQQMIEDSATRLLKSGGRPSSNEHCELGVGQARATRCPIRLPTRSLACRLAVAQWCASATRRR